jgi:hypothetical protein
MKHSCTPPPQPTHTITQSAPPPPLQRTISLRLHSCNATCWSSIASSVGKQAGPAIMYQQCINKLATLLRDLALRDQQHYPRTILLKTADNSSVVPHSACGQGRCGCIETSYNTGWQTEGCPSPHMNAFTPWQGVSPTTHRPQKAIGYSWSLVPPPSRHHLAPATKRCNAKRGSSRACAPPAKPPRPPPPVTVACVFQVAG